MKLSMGYKNHIKSDHKKRKKTSYAKTDTEINL
jgi:hypothetical protein